MPLLAALALPLVGCYALPFASPPLRITNSFAKTFGEQRLPVDGQLEVDTDDWAYVFRGAVHPVQLWRSQQHRRFDVGAGYLVEYFLPAGTEEHTKHGPFLELGWFPLVLRGARSGAARLGVHATGELLLQDRAVGGGAAVGVTFEITNYFHGPLATSSADDDEHEHLHGHRKKGKDGFFVGAGFGEVGVGLGLELAYRRMRDHGYLVLGLNLVIRLPAAAGIYVGFL